MSATTLISFDIGVKNLACCVFERDQAEKYQVVKWEVFDTSKGGVVNLHDIYGLADSLFDVLIENFPVVDENTVVLIENQPCMKNPVMKSLQMMIFSYFMMRGKDMGPPSWVRKDVLLKTS